MIEQRLSFLKKIMSFRCCPNSVILNITVYNVFDSLKICWKIVMGCSELFFIYYVFLLIIINSMGFPPWGLGNHFWFDNLSNSLVLLSVWNILLMIMVSEKNLSSFFYKLFLWDWLLCCFCYFVWVLPLLIFSYLTYNVKDFKFLLCF